MGATRAELGSAGRLEAGADEKRLRSVYSPPAIEASGTFETLAMACGLLDGSPLPACDASPTTS